MNALREALAYPRSLLLDYEHFAAVERLDAAITEVEAGLAGGIVSSSKFRLEVQDKLSVVADGASNPNLWMRMKVLRQCEDFLVEQFEQAVLAEKARADAAERRERGAQELVASLAAEIEERMQREQKLVEALRHAQGNCPLCSQGFPGKCTKWAEANALLAPYDTEAK